LIADVLGEAGLLEHLGWLAHGVDVAAAVSPKGESALPRPWRLEVSNFVAPEVNGVVRHIPGGEVPGWSAQWGEVAVVSAPVEAPAYWCFDKLPVAPNLKIELERAFAEHLSFRPVLAEP
jgi:hypothetical protein